MDSSKTPPQKPAAELCTHRSAPGVDLKEPSGLHPARRLHQPRVFAQVTPEFLTAHDDRAP